MIHDRHDILPATAPREMHSREQKQSLNIALINLRKAFDLVSRDDLFKVLARIGCLSAIQSFHRGMRRVVEFNGSS
jgi:hypothetical protein